MSGFKYDSITLIELVESKPCLWDKTDDNYKSKNMRDKSWQEIFEFLEEGYDRMSQPEKKAVGEVVIAKWTNIKDAFLRSLRLKNGQGTRKKYLYSDHLQFLLKYPKGEKTDDIHTRISTEEDTIKVEDFMESSLQIGDSTSTSISAKLPCGEIQLRPKLKRKTETLENPEELKRGKLQCSCCRSEKELIIMSFLPYMKDMSEAEVLDFQMEVLKLIKKIKERRGREILTS